LTATKNGGGRNYLRKRKGEGSDGRKSLIKNARKGKFAMETKKRAGKTVGRKIVSIGIFGAGGRS